MRDSRISAILARRAVITEKKKITKVFLMLQHYSKISVSCSAVSGIKIFSSSLKQEGIGKRRFCVYICSPPDNLEISLPEFSSNTNPLRSAIVAFENVSGEVQMENNWCTSMMKAQSLNFSREAWTEPKKCSQVWGSIIHDEYDGLHPTSFPAGSLFLLPPGAKKRRWEEDRPWELGLFTSFRYRAYKKGCGWLQRRSIFRRSKLGHIKKECPFCFEHTTYMYKTL